MGRPIQTVVVPRGHGLPPRLASFQIGGYGDRAGHMETEVITTHTACKILEDDKAPPTMMDDMGHTTTQCTISRASIWA